MAKLLDTLIKLGNVSGSIRPAPHNLKQLKQSVQGVPFQLLVPGMAGVLNLNNLLQVVQALAKLPNMGGLAGLGQLQPLIGQLTRSGTSAAVGQQQGLTPANIAAAMGQGAAWGSALMAYGGALASVQQVAGANTSP